MVAPPDRRLVKAQLPGRRELPGVTRDDLPNAAHPGPRGLEESADQVLAAQPSDAPFPATGKATYCAAATTASSQPWRSATHAT